MATSCDVVIAGAGPAGVACAVALVRRDPSLRGRLVVLDRARFPRDKPCGGGLTGHAEEAMAALGLELAVPAVASADAEVRYGAERRRVALGRPVRVIERRAFDASLVAQARDLGVVVCEGRGLRGFEVRDGGVEVGTSDGAITARVLVGADGVGSLVRKRLHDHAGKRRAAATAAAEAGASSPEAAAVEQPIRLFRLEVARGRAWPGDTMLYDFSPMAEGLRGYLWIFPMPGDRLNVGLMHYPATALSGAELTALLGRHLERHGVTLARPARGWPAFAYRPRAPVAGPHLVTVGDAAGIDALTGEGIAVGMEHGLVAAAYVLAALDGAGFAFRGYRAALRRATVGRELALDRRLAEMLYRGSWRRWLSLVLYDERMLGLYAARVSGSLVLADRKRELAWALARHLVRGRRRTRALAAALPG